MMEPPVYRKEMSLRSNDNSPVSTEATATTPGRTRLYTKTCHLNRPEGGQLDIKNVLETSIAT